MMIMNISFVTVFFNISHFSLSVLVLRLNTRCNLMCYTNPIQILKDPELQSHCIWDLINQ